LARRAHRENANEVKGWFIMDIKLSMSRTNVSSSSVRWITKRAKFIIGGHQADAFGGLGTSILGTTTILTLHICLLADVRP
jgi:hypothetical protein